MEREFTRQQLYDLVWQEPLRTLAKTLGISDVRFAKICRHANIPLPGLGYWAKHAHGKATPRPSLPARALGQHDVVKIGGHRWHQTWLSDDDVLRTEVPPPPSFPETLDEVTARARKLVGRVPQVSLKKPHPLITKLLQDDDDRRRKTAELSWHWDKPIFDSPMDQRRLRLINRLFWAFVRLGCKPAVLGKEASAFSVTVGDEIVRFTLDPPGTDRTDPRARPARMASDSKILQVELSWYQPPTEIRVSWIDSATQPLEEQLTDVAVGLLVAGERLYREGLIRHRDWLVGRKRELTEQARREEAERQRKEREKILKREQARRERLLSDAENWNKATLVRQYVHAVLAEPRLSDAGAAASTWAQWALAEADRMDPLSQSPDHLIAILGETGGEH